MSLRAECLITDEAPFYERQECRNRGNGGIRRLAPLRRDSRSRSNKAHAR